MRTFLLASFLIFITMPSWAQSDIQAPNITPAAEETAADASSDPLWDAPARQAGYRFPTSKERRERYVKSLVGPMSLARTVVKAGWSTWRNSPEEWGDTWEGFGRRVASGMGKKAIKQTTIYALDEGMKLDSHFYRSTNKSVGARVRNALISPVTSRNRDGKRVFGLPRIAGTYAASIIAAEAWYPDRYNYKNGLRSGTISLGFNAAFNLFKEFVWKK